MPTIKKQSPGNSKSKAKPRAKGVLSRISPIGFDKGDGIKLNLYGKSGTGKTTFWATFPKPVLAILCSGGTQTGELRSIDTPSYRRSISQVSLENSSELSELVSYQREEGKFKTVVLDHATGLQDLVLKEVLGLEEVPTQLSWGIATQQQYGQVALQMKERLRSLLDLSCHVVIVAQEREFNVDTDSSLLMPFVGSALTPSVTGWLNPACDYICQTFIRNKVVYKEIKVAGKNVRQEVSTKEVEYCLRTAPDPVYTTKFRLPKGIELPEVIVDPDFSKVEALIQGGK